MNLKNLIGSGDKIMKFTLPFLVVGLILNIMSPSLFSLGSFSSLLKTVSMFILPLGIINWLWSAILVLTKIPKGELITTGPYSLVKHPLYTGVAFLVLPWVGFLLDSWLGLAIGLVLYAASRKYAPEEENKLSKTFKEKWTEYVRKVLVPWV